MRREALDALKRGTESPSPGASRSPSRSPTPSVPRLSSRANRAITLLREAWAVPRNDAVDRTLCREALDALKRGTESPSPGASRSPSRSPTPSVPRLSSRANRAITLLREAWAVPRNDALDRTLCREALDARKQGTRSRVSSARDDDRSSYCIPSICVPLGAIPSPPKSPTPSVPSQVPRVSSPPPWKLWRLRQGVAARTRTLGTLIPSPRSWSPSNPGSHSVPYPRSPPWNPSSASVPSPRSSTPPWRSSRACTHVSELAAPSELGAIPSPPKSPTPSVPSQVPRVSSPPPWKLWRLRQGVAARTRTLGTLIPSPRSWSPSNPGSHSVPYPRSPPWNPSSASVPSPRSSTPPWRSSRACTHVSELAAPSEPYRCIFGGLNEGLREGGHASLTAPSSHVSELTAPSESHGDRRPGHFPRTSGAASSKREQLKRKAERQGLPEKHYAEQYGNRML